MERRANTLILSICVFVMILGCQGGKKAEATADMPAAKNVEVKETVPAAIPEANAAVAKPAGPAPKIKFESTTVDLGDIKPESKNIANYTFTNAGKGTLKISDIVKTCGCTPFELDKREYAPGEKGTIKVEYQSTKAGGAITKHLYVMSNDPCNPRQEIVLKANVVLQVIVEPQTIQLSLDQSDAGAPLINIYSKDNKSFTIKSVESTNNTITAEIDPNNSAAKFAVKLKVDLEKLKTNLNGYVKFNITHPDIDTVSITYSSLAEFEIQPASLILRNALPLKIETREVWVKNNYNKPFEIESINSKNGNIKVLKREKQGELYKLTLEITPPETQKVMFFSDVLTVKIKNGASLDLNCRGFYKR